MSVKRVVPRAQADKDIDEAIDHYQREAGETVALGFVDALEHAYRHIARYPGSGSTRYAHELELPGLRSWPLKRYPYVVFFVERDDHVDVWRVLHAERDIPAGLREPGDS
ncbi:MAG: type II toxin-antitoxin system RelE/ParE family toxin [Alphaproteobacteria bacterium]|nr:type II toxin-antitoxin system RelE/ParE family toxin [Alphaproteobacteria bacterium]